VRFLPVVATAEVKTVLPQAAAHPPQAPVIQFDEQGGRDTADGRLGLAPGGAA
jgi:hypothetical protein